MNKKNKFAFLSLILFLIIIFASTNKNSEILRYNQEKMESLFSANNLEGAENIVITAIDRAGNVSAYGMVNIQDKLTIKNNNDNPIYSILFGIPLKHLDDLIFYKASGGTGNSLVVERNYIILDEYEMLTIYFDSPLLPHQSINISFYHSYKNLFTYELINIEGGLQLDINMTFTIWPIMPYRAEGNIHTMYIAPSTATNEYYEQIGETGGFDDYMRYHWFLNETGIYDHLDPFLSNLQDQGSAKNGGQYISFVFYDNTLYPTVIQIEELIRNIKISPWGLIQVEEEFQLHNKGLIDQRQIFFNIPINAKNVRVFDELGDLDVEFGAVMVDTRRILISLSPKRAPLTPSSRIDLTITYNISPDNNFYINWFQQSLRINLITTQFEFLIIGETINLIIEGCGAINFISTTPNSITLSRNTKTLTYYSDYVSPIESKLILITYVIDLFDLLLRPIIIILALCVILALYILISKRRKIDESVSIFKKEFLPVNEIREFCSLYEEKNALNLEIRKAEDDTKRKKIARKSYNNILEKNSSKIEQIKQEIQPFKKLLAETSDTFSNIIKKLDLLDAERLSVDDSINLLESRYKRGKLPSKAAYEKLANDFLNRRKKIDRTIDRYIQQLRSYLL